MFTRDDIPALMRGLRRAHDQLAHYRQRADDATNRQAKYDAEEANFYAGQRNGLIRALNELTHTGIDPNPWAIGIDRNAQIEAFLDTPLIADAA